MNINKKQKTLANKLQKLFEKTQGYNANSKDQKLSVLAGYQVICGYFHSDTLDGKFTRVQKKFIKKQDNKLLYVGNKRFACPIVDRLAGKIDY